MTQPAVTISDLHHDYMQGTPLSHSALSGVNLTVASGEVLALVGSTGSGKSTLLQHMNGIYTPQSGSVQVLGKDLSDPGINLTQLRREVGLVLQNPEHQIFERYVGDDVAFGPRMSGLSGKDLTRRVRWAMETVGLDFDLFKDRPTFALSGGERRKVGLAGVVALKPTLLLLDEPTAGLDPEAHDELLGRLSGLNAQGMTLVMATHSMDDVAAIAERVAILERGRVAVSGPVAEVFSRPDEIRSYGLDLPSAAEIANALALRGVEIGTGVLNLDQAEEAILAAFGVTV